MNLGAIGSVVLEKVTKTALYGQKKGTNRQTNQKKIPIYLIFNGQIDRQSNELEKTSLH